MTRTPKGHFSRRMRLALGWVASLWLVVSCAQDEVVNDLQRKPYFDLPALVQQQLYWLDSLNPLVKIQARIGAETATETLQKDSAAWAETLQLFQQVDINRPVFQGSYEESDSVADDGRIKTYRHRQKNAEVPYLRVYYRDSLSNVYRIETAFQEDNVLYSTYRSMKMTFTPHRKKPRLIAFETIGRQKMMLRDSVTYVTRGELRYE